MKKNKVLLGMSGGVDSSVSALLLKKQGYEIIGCTMKLWDSTNVSDAKKVCEQLGIKHITIDCQNEFKCKVIDCFIDEYKSARTPNPCVECNQHFKFGAFYEKAKELGCDYIATGHYASIEYSEKYNKYVLKKSKEEKKDQTYFLYTINKEKLEHILFPLENYLNKEETRKIAEENGLEVATKKESQEICFIENDNYKEFLIQHGNYKNKKGNIVLKDGTILGEHEGFVNYTIGQRKGLRVSYKEPLYVINLNKEKNEVIVGTEEQLYSKELIAEKLNWLLFDKLEKPIKCKVKIRYRAKEAVAILYPEEEEVKVIFEEKQRAITPGQAIVFYDEDGVVIGGGKIIKNF